jgi:hypothetical protein
VRVATMKPPIVSKRGSQSSSSKNVKSANVALAFNSEVGDLISASPEVFDGDEPGSWSAENRARCFGVVTKVWSKGKLLQVKWNDEAGTSSQILQSDVLKDARCFDCPVGGAVYKEKGLVI